MSWRRVVLPGGTDAGAQRPAAGGGMVAVGCSWDKPARGRVPVLAVHDVDGSPGFVIGHEAAGGAGVQASEPVIDGDLVRAAVYELERELIVVGAYGDGTQLPHTSIGAVVRDGDVDSKLGMRIAGCGEVGFVVSWLYRGKRDQQLARFSDGAGEPAWSAREWLVMATPVAVLGVTAAVAFEHHRAAPDGSRLVCHDPVDGRVRWEREASFVDVAGAVGGAFVLIDRSARYADWRRVQIWPTSPSRVSVVDAITGRELAHHETDGEIISACASDGAISVITCDEQGRGQVVTWAAGGVTRADVPIGVRRLWPPDHAAPALVGHADGIPVIADVDALQARGRVTLPFPIRGFHTRPSERRLAKANAVVAYGHVYARHDDGLWICELP